MACIADPSGSRHGRGYRYDLGMAFPQRPNMILNQLAGACKKGAAKAPGLKE